MTQVQADTNMRRRTEARLFTRVVQSFVHNSLSWRVTDTVKSQIRNWGAICTSKITNKPVHEETLDPMVW
jgi:hypothetical protein